MILPLAVFWWMASIPARVTLNSLRSQIGIVLQETTLFAATIR
jgi:ABC-type transport system involved in Fe-S cluster assembly fused permease/ATPase subunit